MARLDVRADPSGGPRRAAPPANELAKVRIERAAASARRQAECGDRHGELPVNAKTLATTYFPERLPSQYLRRWRA